MSGASGYDVHHAADCDAALPAGLGLFSGVLAGEWYSGSRGMCMPVWHDVANPGLVSV
ncbi:MAG: hypothetical protein ABIK43_05130 [candidate division WOR-3 bacterium]